MSATGMQPTLSFSFSDDAGMLLDTRNEAMMSASERGLLGGAGRHRVRRVRRIAPMASMTMSQSSDAAASGTAKVPLFMLASASSSPAPPSNAPAWRVAVGNLAAGAVSGCAVEAALYPIDTIKTRLQAAIGGGGLRALLASGGGKGLYAGVFQNLAGVAPASAIFISVYEPVKKGERYECEKGQHVPSIAIQRSVDGGHRLNTWVQANVSPERVYLGPIAGGAAAGIASSIVRVPTEVIKSRLQTGEVKGAIAAIRSIVAKEGIKGLYAGYGAFLLRDLPFDAIEFVVYEQLKRGTERFVGREANPGETSIIGAIAGGFTGIVTTPLDVLKTRLMVSGTAARYNNLFDAAATIVREEGAAALMKGWQPRLMWISLGGFVFFPVLEASKKFFAPKAVEMPVTPLK